jgi:hypothetical protein
MSNRPSTRKTRIQDREAETKQLSIRCNLCDDTFAFPASSMSYAVYEPGETTPIQWGQTDLQGSFRIPRASEFPRMLSVQYSDASGKQFTGAMIRSGLDRHSLTLPFESWRIYKRCPDEEEPQLNSHYTTYREMVDKLSLLADAKGVSVKIATNRCLQAAYELDHFTRVTDRVLRWETGAIDELADLVQRRRGHRVLKSLLREKARPPEHRLTLGEAAGKNPSFGPGMGNFFSQVLQFGVRHREFGLLLLDVLFDLNRNVTPVVRSFRISSAGGPQTGLLPYAGGGINSGDPDIPTGLTDPYNTRGPGLGLPGNTFPDHPELDPTQTGWPSEPLSPQDKILIRCELALWEAYDTATQTAGAASPGGGGGNTLTIREITPNKERQQGDRKIHISVVASRQQIVQGTTTVPVSFPTQDGRKEVNGTIVASSPSNGDDWQHEIEVNAPIRTIEGLVQVLGFPPECTGTQPSSDPELDQLFKTVDACAGTRHLSSGGNSAACSAVDLNWLGGRPEIHFRWIAAASGEFVAGDVWLCQGSGSAYQPRNPDPHNALTEDRRFRLADGNEVSTTDWVKVRYLEDGANWKPCVLRHESVLMHLEADERLEIEYLTTNDPTNPTSFKLSPPLPPSVAGPASHPIAGTLYHVDWDNESVVARGNWAELGVGSAHGQFSPITFPLSVLGRIVEPRVQLVQAAASNSLIGFGQRVLEVLRYVRPARVEAIRVIPMDGRDLTDHCVGPDEMATIEVEVGMPTHAATGVRGIVELKLGNEIIGTLPFQQASKNSVFLSLDCFNFRDHIQEGRTNVSATVKYAYTSNVEFPEGVALGEMNGEGKSISLVILPRIAVFCFLGQWGKVFNDDGTVNDTWAVGLVRGIEHSLQDGIDASLVARLTITGRVGPQARLVRPDPVLDPFGWFNVEDAPTEGTPKQLTELNQARGCVQMFASECWFNLGNNDWGLPMWPWYNDPISTAISAARVDQYMGSSGLAEFINDVMGPGGRKTYFLFIGHSRGGGASFNIMNWLSRRAPAARWKVLAAIYFDAMHTDGVFQPVLSFPVCADEMLHFYATRDTYPLIGPKNHEWMGNDVPNCPGSHFSQIALDETHSQVPEAPGVLQRTETVLLEAIRKLVGHARYG